MRLRDKKLPRFEASASYEKYAAEGTGFQDPSQAGSNALDTFDVHVKQMASVKLEELDQEERISRVITCIGAQNSLREVLYKTLEHCAEPRTFAELEEFVTKTDEFAYGHLNQSPYTLIGMLVRAGGLHQTDIDAQGSAVDAALRESMSADDYDDLVAGQLLTITEAGSAAVELLAPEKRLKAQLAQYPHRYGTYIALLEYCIEPRSFPQIKEYYDATPEFAHDVVADHHKLSPDFYVDKLDKAGALVWRGAWVTTEVGRRLLEDNAAA